MNNIPKKADRLEAEEKYIKYPQRTRIEKYYDFPTRPVKSTFEKNYYDFPIKPISEEEYYDFPIKPISEEEYYDLLLNIKEAHSITEISEMINQGLLTRERYDYLIIQGIILNYLIKNEYQKKPATTSNQILATFLTCKNDIESDLLRAYTKIPVRTPSLLKKLAFYNITWKEVLLLNLNYPEFEKQKSSIRRRLKSFLEQHKDKYPGAHLEDLINILNAAYVFKFIKLLNNTSEQETPEGQNPGTPRVRRTENN